MRCYSTKGNFSQITVCPQAHRLSVACRAQQPDQGDPGAWVLPNTTKDGDWREFRAQLVSRSRTTPQASWDVIDDGTQTGGSAAGDGDEDWAHLIATPETGCVLLANPMLFGSSQTYFEQAVILVIEHSEKGSMGIILNKPSELRLKQMEDVVLDSQFRVFAKNKVYLGGDVDADGLYLLHEHHVPGAAQVRPNLYLGGADGLCESVSNGEILPESVFWFCRYAGWNDGQLADECARNVWYPVSCSTSMLLPRMPKNNREGPELWHDIMELIGDDFKAVSQRMRKGTSRPQLP
eukprot:jgi/Ulvmu1/3879/UM018_0100.1